MSCAWQIETGASYPLGATPTESGVNFALVSEHAERVELCLYDANGQYEVARFDLPARTGDLWHGFIPKLDLSLTYGYRVHGRYAPEAGLRFNANKLLLDPYAKGLSGSFNWSSSHFGYNPDDPDLDLSFSGSDNADHMVKARIIQSDHAPVRQRPWRVSPGDRVIYELHVKGFTQGFELCEAGARGTLSALAQPAVLAYLKGLGVTTLELLPVHAFIDDYFLKQRNLSNYWGYNTLSFFAPHQAYLNHPDPMVFRRVVDQLHEAGFEVVLDVVYNHTAESDQLGPTLSMRGIDNSLYYRLAENKRNYINDTGCGNTLNFDQPRVVQWVMDSLRYWSGEQGVDGFRFDLATVLGRRKQGFDAAHPLFQAISQDPQLNSTLLIAEPWDLGPGGYQLGSFGRGWLEWNDRYRDAVRRFWRGDKGVVPEFAKRIHGSADIFEGRKRGPNESLNFITAHDGFTLRDLTSFNHRRNALNGENNRDGHHENFSRNWGHEGETEDAKILQQRSSVQRAMLMTLYLSQGTPMLLAGDERHRTQRGNNNAYCQDNEINWVDWTPRPEAQALNEFVSQLAMLRRNEPLLGCEKYIHRPESHEERSTLWFNCDAEELSEAQWHQDDLCHLGYLLLGGTGESTLYLVFNRACEAKTFRLPKILGCTGWQTRLCSATNSNLNLTYDACATLELPASSVTLFSTLNDLQE